MPPEYRIAYFAHTIRSDWNNGNAHFLRGLLRAMTAMGHDVQIFEPHCGWSITNLRKEPGGQRSLCDFSRTYPDLQVHTYEDSSAESFREQLRDAEIVILHEWNEPQLARTLLDLRDELGFRLLFHDTHHRASSSPEQIRLFGLDGFDGVLAFGEALHRIYRDQFNLRRVWVLHEAADTTVFRPVHATKRCSDVVWIGNWGDDERAAELREFLLEPAKILDHRRFSAYGVRYPRHALEALRESKIAFRGYLANLDGPSVYGSSGVTVHVPRQLYAAAMSGIPTIRVFEALACGIPLVSAPWNDAEHLFNQGDIWFVNSAREMALAIETLLCDPQCAAAQAERGLNTVLDRHTCMHRAEHLTSICEEVLR